jgi:hypothetical protein
MDHKMAESNHLVEKYMTDEMSEPERTEFEDHMFGCPICSERVRQDFTLIENLKALPLAEVLPASAAGRDWRAWFRVPSLVPTLSALTLACVLGYQHIGAGAGDAARMLPQLAVLQPVTKGADGVVTILVNRKSSTSFELSVNADTLATGSFTCEVEDAAGKKILSPFASETTQNTAMDLRIQLPTKDFPAGRYQLLLRPAAEPDSIVAYPFAVENTK